MWAGNNEDFFWFEFSTYLRVVPKTDSTLAFIYFDYPFNNFPQGGVNEAGLFYDANAVKASEPKNAKAKVHTSETGRDLLLQMLGKCKSVHDAINLFDEYDMLIQGAQVHLADRDGNKGIITTDSSWISYEDFQVSTNYDLSQKDDDYKKCWRYPIAYSMLKNSEPDFKLMGQICDSTSQRRGAHTIYSNVHNLTTGEMWVYYGSDYENPYKTSFEELASLGDTTILFRDLFHEQTLVKAYNISRKDGFQSAINFLDTLVDSVEREEKVKLLSLGLLFDIETFMGSRKLKIVSDDHLIEQMIEASNDLSLLNLIRNLNVSEINKRKAIQRIEDIQESGINYRIILIVLLIAACAFLLYVWLERRFKKI